MKYRQRIYYTDTQKALMWDRLEEAKDYFISTQLDAVTWLVQA